MSALLELIQSGLPWEELRPKLVSYPYATPARSSVRSDDVWQHWLDVDDMTFNDEGTWDEVRRARNMGLITNDQYLEVARALGSVTAAVQQLELGDVEGHPFRGNQYTKGEGLPDNFVDRLNEELAGDRPWSQSFMPPMPPDFSSRLGECYVISGRYMMDHRDADLVHGTIQGAGNPPLMHAWAVNADGSVHEPASDRDYTPETFKELFNAEERVRYSNAEAMSEMVETGNFGPWDDEGLATEEDPELYLAVAQSLELGDSEGHPFRGNQYSGRLEGEEREAAVRTMAEAWMAGGYGMDVDPNSVRGVASEVRDAWQQLHTGGGTAGLDPQVVAFVHELDKAPPSTQPLFRGESADEARVAEIMRLSDEDSFRLPPVGTTAVDGIATSFSTAWHGDQRVLWEFSPGVTALNLDHYLPDWATDAESSEEEFVVSGRMEITDMREEDGFLHVMAEPVRNSPE